MSMNPNQETVRAEVLWCVWRVNKPLAGCPLGTLPWARLTWGNICSDGPNTLMLIMANWKFLLFATQTSAPVHLKNISAEVGEPAVKLFFFFFFFFFCSRLWSCSKSASVSHNVTNLHQQMLIWIGNFFVCVLFSVLFAFSYQSLPSVR